NRVFARRAHIARARVRRCGTAAPPSSQTKVACKRWRARAQRVCEAATSFITITEEWTMARFEERRAERSPRHPDWDYERDLRRMRSRHEEEQDRGSRGRLDSPYYGGGERWSEDYGRRYGMGSGSCYEDDYPRRSEGWGEDYGRGQYAYGGREE